MWDDQDKNGFDNETMHGRGQITLDTEMGKLLFDLASDGRYHRFLEIGTWNGLGSTKCIAEGFKERKNRLKGGRKGEEEGGYFLDSLEINKDKCDLASRYYENVPAIRIWHARLIDVYPSWDEIMDTLGIRDSKDISTLKRYLDTDMGNVNVCETFVPRHATPSYEQRYYDVVILDGSELLSYWEYMKVCHWTNIIILDDCRCLKNAKVYEELMRDEDWRLLQENLGERNGYAAFIRKDT